MKTKATLIEKSEGLQWFQVEGEFNGEYAIAPATDQMGDEIEGATLILNANAVPMTDSDYETIMVRQAIEAAL